MISIGYEGKLSIRRTPVGDSASDSLIALEALGVVRQTSLSSSRRRGVCLLIFDTDDGRTHPACTRLSSPARQPGGCRVAIRQSRKSQGVRSHNTPSTPYWDWYEFDPRCITRLIASRRTPHLKPARKISLAEW